MSDGSTMVWRVTAAMRVAWVLAGVLVGGVAGLGTLLGVVHDSSGSGPVVSTALSVLFVIASVLGVWAFAFRPLVRLDGTAVTIVNPLRAVRIPMERVRAVSPGYWGVCVSYVDGDRMRVVEAWAVPKARLSVWLRRHTRADECAAAISRASEHVG